MAAPENPSRARLRARRPLLGPRVLIAIALTLVRAPRSASCTLGAGDPPAFAPVGHRPRDLQPIQGSKLYDDTTSSDRAARRAPDLRAAGTDPQTLRDAVIGRRPGFYSHWAWTDRHRPRDRPELPAANRRGGSTITQQLAKVLFLTADKSRAEAQGSRPGARVEPLLQGRILEMYLNRCTSARRVRGRGGGANVLRQVVPS